MPRVVQLRVAQAAGKLAALSTKNQVCEGVKTMVQLDSTSTCSFSLFVNPACSHFVSASVMETKQEFMVDTGAAVSFMSCKIWSALGGEKLLQLSPWGGKQFVGVVGSPLMVLGVCTLDLRFTDLVIQADLVVIDCLAVESIIGLDFLERQGCVVDLPNKLLQVRGLSVPLVHGQDTDSSQQIPADVAVVATLSIPHSVKSRLWHHAIQ